MPRTLMLMLRLLVGVGIGCRPSVVRKGNTWLLLALMVIYYHRIYFQQRSTYLCIRE